MSFFAQAASQGGAFVKFDEANIHKRVEMEITGPYQVRPSTYQGQPKLTKKGQPVMEAVVPVRVDGESKTFSDGGKWRLQKAVGEAVVKSGAPDLQIGGVLAVTYTGKVPAKGGGMADTYEVEYVPAGEGAQAATPVAATAPQGVPQEAPAPQQQAAPQQFQPQAAPQFAPQAQSAPAFGNPQAAQAGFSQQNPWANA
jgi:hypothetical protein